MSKVEKRRNAGDKNHLQASLAKAALRNHLEMTKREAVFRRYGYDSPASIAFVLSKILPLGGQVLEVGSGKGRFLTALAGHVTQITSVDIDAEEHHFAILNAVHAGVSSRIRFVVQNAQQLGWRAGVFDAVVTMNAMHHFPNPDRALWEMVRVLKPSGKLVICDFSPEGFHLMDQIQQAEGKTHPHPARRFPHWQAWLRELGFRTRTWTGCHQELLVAQGDRSEVGAPETVFVL
jgi:ubiquinone/menaquinone biosynthesis C-methylase UbiE